MPFCAFRPRSELNRAREEGEELDDCGETIFDIDTTVNASTGTSTPIIPPLNVTTATGQQGIDFVHFLSSKTWRICASLRAARSMVLECESVSTGRLTSK